MFRKINDFLESWAYENNATYKLFSILTDSSLKQKVYPEGRELGFLAWHIVTSLGEMGGKAELIVAGPPEDSDEPNNAKKIAEDYKKAADSLGEEIKNKWNDNMLMEEISLYGQKWTRSKLLGVLIGHQAHHRAQMTVLMRQAGLPVIGIYGPAKEEWSSMGMQPLK